MIVFVIDDHKSPTVGGIQLQSRSVGHSGHNRIDRNRLKDGEVKEMIIGVGNSQFMWVCGELSRSYPSRPPVVSVPIPTRAIPSPAMSLHEIRVEVVPRLQKSLALGMARISWLDKKPNAGVINSAQKSFEGQKIVRIVADFG